MATSDPLEALALGLQRPGGRPSSDFDLNPDVVLPEGRKLREAGVLVPILTTGAEPRVILTKRSSALKHHPGQIAFPGGKRDDSDPSIEAAALREAHEEIGLPHGAANVLGQMPGHETVTGFNITPIVARVEADFDPVPEAGEVAEVFDVPLAHLMEPDNYRIEGRRWRGQRRLYYAVPYGPYYIWGATARILRALADRVAR